MPRCRHNPAEHQRADMLEVAPDGSGLHVHAWQIRNAVGLAMHPQTGELWGSVNERDGLGDNIGVAMGNDGSLLITDDGSNSVWRVSYESAH